MIHRGGGPFLFVLLLIPIFFLLRKTEEVERKAGASSPFNQLTYATQVKPAASSENRWKLEYTCPNS